MEGDSRDQEWGAGKSRTEKEENPIESYIIKVTAVGSGVGFHQGLLKRMQNALERWVKENFSIDSILHWLKIAVLASLPTFPSYPCPPADWTHSLVPVVSEKPRKESKAVCLKQGTIKVYVELPTIARTG